MTINLQTGEYYALARWINEECVTGANQWGYRRQSLGGRWKAWSEANNEWTGTRKSFAQGLKDRGFQSSKSQGVRGYAGFDLKAKPMSAADVLQAARAAGISIEVDGEDLLLEAFAEPPAADARAGWGQSRMIVLGC
jgi:hypothetical protein